MPAAIGATVLTLLGPIGTGLTAAGITAAQVGGFLLTAGAIGAQLLLRPSTPRGPQPEGLTNTSEGKEGPGRFAFGRVRVGGQVVFGNTAEYDIYQLLAHYHGPCSATEEWFYDGRSITLTAEGNVSSPPFGKFGGASFMQLQTKPGDGTETAWADLLTDFPSMWTSDHRVRGIAQTLATFVNPGTGDPKFAKLYTGGIKQIERVDRAGLFYDPRDDTDKWTMNSALICLHYRRLRPGVTLADFDLDDIGDTADACDALVATRDGTEPRSRLSGGGEGQVTTDMLLDMYKSAGLEERRTAEGKITFRLIEDDPVAEVHFTSQHIIDRVRRKGPEGAQRPNVCRVKYFAPPRKYTVAEIPLQTFGGVDSAYDGPAWARIDAEIAAYGEHETTIELPFCPSAAQAQRIARRIFHEQRAVQGSILTTFAGLAAWQAHVVDIDFPDTGTSEATETLRCRIGAPIVHDADGTCEIPFLVIPALVKTAWSTTDDERDPPPVLVEGEFGGELDQPAAPPAAGHVEFPGSALKEMRIDVPPFGEFQLEARYRTYTGGEPDAWLPMSTLNSSVPYVTGDFEGEQVDFQIRYFSADGDESSLFSESLEVGSLAETNATPGVPTIDLTVTGTAPSEDDIVLEIMAPDTFSVVAIEVRIYTGATTHYLDTHDVRPGGFVSITEPYPTSFSSIVVEATAITTDETTGSTATDGYTRP